MDEASRVLGELDSRTHLKLSLMIENLVPIDKKKKKIWCDSGSLFCSVGENDLYFLAIFFFQYLRKSEHRRVQYWLEKLLLLLILFPSISLPKN